MRKQTNQRTAFGGKKESEIERTNRRTNSVKRTNQRAVFGRKEEPENGPIRDQHSENGPIRDQNSENGPIRDLPVNAEENIDGRGADEVEGVSIAATSGRGYIASVV